MFYAEVLRGRKVTLWVCAILGAACALIALASALFPDKLRLTPGNDAPALATVLWGAAVASAIVASILGASLANENCHLEFVWPRPISRARYAVGVQIVDLVYLVVTFASTVGVGLLIAWILNGRPLAIAFDQAFALKALRILIFPIAWFGLIQALTAGVKSNAAGGWIIGITWPTAEGLSILATLPLIAPLHAALAFLNLANPIGYFPFWEAFDDSRGHSLRPYFGYGLSLDTAALAAIALVGIFVAVARWRRQEV